MAVVKKVKMDDKEDAPFSSADAPWSIVLGTSGGHLLLVNHGLAFHVLALISACSRVLVSLFLLLLLSPHPLCLPLTSIMHTLGCLAVLCISLNYAGSF